MRMFLLGMVATLTPSVLFVSWALLATDDSHRSGQIPDFD